MIVHNFQVEDFHTYYGGENGVLVHNACTRETPHLEDGNSKEGWQHVENRHITGTDPGGDLFAPGTNRAQIEAAARRLVKKGRLVTDPKKVIQIFEKKIIVNKMKDLVRVVVS